MPSYHYYGIKQLNVLKTAHIEGILTTINPLKTMDDYADAKEAIGKELEGGSAGLIICNLSKLED